jgi:CRISPR-associated protein (TIGR03984 family)
MGLDAYSYTSLGTIPIAEALTKFASDGYIHVMGRRIAGFGTIAANGVAMLDGQTLESASLEEVFEIRLFNELRELRWLREGAAGRAVLLAAEIDDQAGTWITEPVIATIRTSYFVWGVSEGPLEGSAEAWSGLFDSRIGVQTIPGSHPAGTRVAVRAIEYLSAESTYGNAAVCEERWCGIENLGKGN